MDARSKVGGWIGVLAAVLGTAGAFYLFTGDWWPLYNAELAHGRWDEAKIVAYILPGLNDLMMASGVLWAISAYGFFTSRRWAWSLGVVAAVATLVGSFFWTIPAMSRGVAPRYMFVFIPNFLFYLTLLWYVKPVNRWLLALSVLTGIAYVLTFMDGVASTDRIILGQGAVFVACQRLNWLAAAAWAVATAGLAHYRSWARVVGMGAGLLGFVGGTPVSVLAMMQSGEISLFAPAPVLSLLLAVLLLLPPVARWYDRLCGTATPTAEVARAA